MHHSCINLQLLNVVLHNFLQLISIGLDEIQKIGMCDSPYVRHQSYKSIIESTVSKVIYFEFHTLCASDYLPSLYIFIF